MSSPDRQELIANAVAFLADPKVCVVPAADLDDDHSDNPTHSRTGTSSASRPAHPVSSGKGPHPAGD
jgi:hypothetical protein